MYGFFFAHGYCTSALVHQFTSAMVHWCTQFVASMHNYHQGHFQIYFKYVSNNKILHFWEKCEKIKKDSENHNSKNIDPIDFCLAPYERKN